jgi:hypothetical protein
MEAGTTGKAALAGSCQVKSPSLNRNPDYMSDIIERLKTADELEAKELDALGREAGEEWARTEATPRELRRLAEANANNRNADMWSGVPNHLGWAGVLLSVITGADNISRDDLAAVFGDDDESYEEDYLFAFANGALEIWEKVAVAGHASH